MAKLDTLDIKGKRLEFSGQPAHIPRRGENELGCLIDEASNQPRAGDAINLWTFPSYPLHGDLTMRADQ